MKSQTQATEPLAINIAEFPIRLGQLLKYLGIVENGLEAKSRILNGEVLVNDEVELRRGRQINQGDRILIGKTSYIAQKTGS
jgi:ribosome-associated protein